MEEAKANSPRCQVMKPLRSPMSQAVGSATSTPGAGEVMTAAAKAKSHWYVCSSPPRLVKSREMAAVVLHPAILRCICLFPSLSLTLAAAGAGASHHSLFLLASWGVEWIF